MADPHSNSVQSAESFGTSGRVVTPSNNDLDPIPKALSILSAGDITIVPVGNANGDTISYVGLSAGAVIPYRVRRVTAATAAVATIDG